MSRLRIYFGELCSVNNCKNVAKAKKMCRMHYLRFSRYGRYERLSRVGISQANKKYFYPHGSLESMHKKRFGGNREIAIQRDGEKCVDCGITRQEHKEKYKIDITVNHKDGNGRYSENPNNNLDNLETLCLKCHSRKDAIRNIKQRKQFDEI